MGDTPANTAASELQPLPAEFFTHPSGGVEGRPSKREKKNKVKTVQSTANRVTFTPLSEGQVLLSEALRSSRLLCALGPAGTGKTLLAVQEAIDRLDRGDVERIILSRPAVEAGGEKLGFMPGDMKDKLDPYLRPLYDAVIEKLGGPSAPSKTLLDRWIREGTVEIVPLAFMRGRTFKNAYIICDEAQNATYSQIKMCATRLGKGSSMVFTGDTEQCDLPPTISGLTPFAEKLCANYPEKYPVIKLRVSDVQREEIVADLARIL